jgi:hypothetical protein
MASIAELNTDWDNFCVDDLLYNDTDSTNNSGAINNCGIGTNNSGVGINNICSAVIPKCTALYISTKTKICYLNKPIDLKNVFWKIPIIPYHLPQIGVVKKQMKFNSTLQEEVTDILTKIVDYDYVDNYIISQIINPDGRIKFKDIRKISIGLSKKDITSYRCKKKSAFYNCFVVILRLLQNDKFKEINVKVFNTGKLEIPGIQDAETLETVLNLLTEILKPIIADNELSLPLSLSLSYLTDKSETVLINSNFNCGYYINRDNLYNLLKYKYKISSNYDPCSYPGIQCSFYYDSSLKQQTGMMPNGFICNKKIQNKAKCDINVGITSVSFMIFRTGSMLIVGKCTEPILYEIYNFLCKLFETEYLNIVGVQSISSVQSISGSDTNKKINEDKPVKQSRKIRKKTIYITSDS